MLQMHGANVMKLSLIIPDAEVLSDLKQLENVLQASNDLETHCSNLERKYSTTARWIKKTNIRIGSQLQVDQFGQALIPDDISQSSDTFIAYKSTSNGDCLFNSVSRLLVGDDSISCHLRLLTALELSTNSEFYAEHPKLQEPQSSGFSKATLFTICLSTLGMSIWDTSKNPTKAIHAEARVASKTKEWAGTIHLMALASVIGRPIFSVYPNVPLAFRNLLHGMIQPRVAEHIQVQESTVYIMWSRDGNFDATSGRWYEPNHFIPLVKSEQSNIETKESTNTRGAKITDFFQSLGGPQKRKNSELPDSEPPERKQKPDYSANKNTRKLRSETVEKWKSNDLVTYDANVWLTYKEENIGGKKYCTSLKCKVCSEFEQSINKRHNFSRTFIDGSTNFKVSSVIDHANSEIHKIALDQFRRKSGKPATPINKEKNQPTLDFKLGPQPQEEMKKKFDISYFVVKEELPLTKYEKIIELEKRHGVLHSSSYSNRTAATNFISYQADQLKSQLAKDIANSKFYSVIFDGTTDCAVVEQEAVFAIYFDPDPDLDDGIANDGHGPMGKVQMGFLSVENLTSSTAEGVVGGIKTALESLGLSNIGVPPPSPIGVGGDGCNTNRGEKGGVIAILKKEFPWFVFVWCVAHRLELALKDSLNGTYFKEVDECLLRLYYLYEKSPKKMRGLEELYSSYKQCLEFVEGSLKPKRASGTRWILHKVRALKLLVDKFGIYMQHLESLSCDDSVKKTDQAKLKGYLRNWKTGKMFIYSCFFIDLLQSSASLSAAFQDLDVDAVSASQAMTKAKKQLDSLMKNDPQNLRIVKYYLGKVEDATYQGVKLSGLDDAVNRLKKDSSTYVDLVKGEIESRLEGSDDFTEVATLLNCELWDQNYKVDENIEATILKFCRQFQEPLKQQGLKVTEPELLEEWHDMVDYTMQFLKPAKQHYRATWYKLFHSSKIANWQNILLLVRLLFSLPVSNAATERFFSALKRVKSSKRASLSQPTLQGILRITTEGPPLKKYDATSAVLAWHEDKLRRPNQRARRSYKKRRSNKKVIPFPTSEISTTSSSPTITDSDTDNDDTKGSSTQVTLRQQELLRLSEQDSEFDSLFEDEDELE